MDNWIDLMLRCVVEAQERRPVKGALHREILQHLVGIRDHGGFGDDRDRRFSSAEDRGE